MRTLGQFAYNLISGTAAHLILMFLGFLLTLILFGKADESALHLIVAVMLPYFAAGAFLAERRLRWARLVSVISGGLALLVPPMAISAYHGGRWFILETNYWWTLTALPFSYWGCVWIQSRQTGEGPTNTNE